MTTYPLTVPSLRFAGLLATWANEYDIEMAHSVGMVRNGKGTKARYKSVKNQPVILSFKTAGDRAALMQIAREKIEALRTCQVGQRNKRGTKRHPVAVDNIAMQLEAEYEAMS